MPRRGPLPTPLPVLRLRSPDAARRRVNAGELQVPPALPDCPPELDVKERIVWDRLAPLLHDLGVLTKLDADALARYCRLNVRYWDVEERLRIYGDTQPCYDSSGGVIGNGPVPEVKIASDLASQLLRLEVEFGMTAVSRSGLKAADAKRLSALSAFLKERGVPIISEPRKPKRGRPRKETPPT